jgi:integrase
MGRKVSNAVKNTDQSVRAKVKEGKDQARREHRLEGERGLVLVTYPSGVGRFYVYYRNKHGVNRKLLLGNYHPDGEQGGLTLKAACSEADDVRTAIRKGCDPFAEKQVDPTADTFRTIAEMRFAEDDLSPNTIENYRQVLGMKTKGRSGLRPPEFLDMPIREIEPFMIVRAMDQVQRRNNAKRQADSLRFAASSVFEFALGRKTIDKNPAAGIALRHQIKARERVPTDDEIAKLWKATLAPKNGLSLAMGFIFQLAILTGQRRTEVCGARRSELQLDGPAPIWVIPGDTVKRGKSSKVTPGRTKNGEEQRVPLPPQAVAIWREALVLAGDKSEVVFPADLSKVKAGQAPKFPHVSPDAVTKAMIKLRTKFEIEDITVHDMRRAIATWCGDHNIRPDVTDRILNHAATDVTRKHYNHSTLDPLVRQALMAWAAHVQAVVTGAGKAAGAGSNVVELRAG